ncbi:MAG: motility protein A [Lacipirellulaceae bacterium]
MDVASTAGVVIAVVLLLASVAVGGGNLFAFWDSSSVLLVLGGSVAAALISFPSRNLASVLTVARKVFFRIDPLVDDVVAEVVGLAEIARRDGLLALDRMSDDVRNDFLRLGVQMAVDGARAEVIEDVLRNEIEAVATRHRDGKAMIECMGRFAPAFGMIGTLVGLIIMLGDMSDPSKIGDGMAVALLTTLYGALAANVVFLPFAEKLGRSSKQERTVMEVVVRGVLAIQSGEHPRIVERKLGAFLPSRTRSRAA